MVRLCEKALSLASLLFFLYGGREAHQEIICDLYCRYFSPLILYFLFLTYRGKDNVKPVLLSRQDFLTLQYAA